VGGARAGAATKSCRYWLKKGGKWLWDSATHHGRVANELTGQPQEGLLKVVVGLGRDIVVLEVLLAVESNCLGLNLTLLDINLVATQDDGNVLANTDKIAYRRVSDSAKGSAG
jgi:hypothetical protein